MIPIGSNIVVNRILSGCHNEVPNDTHAWELACEQYAIQTGNALHICRYTKEDHMDIKPSNAYS